MSTEKGSVLSRKNDSMLTVVALLLGLVAGILVYQMGDKKELLVIIGMVIMVFGIYFLITMPFSSNQEGYLPSQRSFRLVWGALLTTVGALILFNIYATIDTWVLFVILLLVIAAVVVYLYMNKKG
jgi:uncharacterized membrane protein